MMVLCHSMYIVYRISNENEQKCTNCISMYCANILYYLLLKMYSVPVVSFKILL